MKDYSYYKNIIVKKYNPQNKILTKEDYYSLIRKSNSGCAESENQFFCLTCFYVYDQIARAFSEHSFNMDFEDALQEATLTLLKLRTGTKKTKKTGNYFSKNHIGASYKLFTSIIMRYVAEDLKKATKQFDDKIDIQKSFDINELLQHPEELSLQKISNEELTKMIYEHVPGKGEKKARHRQLVEDWLLHGETYGEAAKQNGVTRSRIYGIRKKSMVNLMKHVKKEDVENLIK